MKRFLPSLGCCALASGLHAAAPHPSTLAVRYQDEILPVVRVAGASPVVRIDGKEIVIGKNPVLVLQRADSFSEARAQLTRIAAAAAPANYDGGADTTQKLDNLRFDLALRSPTTLKGAFATLVTYAVEGIAATPVALQIFAHELPDLPAGKEVQLRIPLAPGVTLRGDVQYFIQVFDRAGREVLLSDMECAWDYFALEEKVRLRLALKPYLATHAGENREAAPFLSVKPVPDPGAAEPGPKMSAVLQVSADGSVERVDLPDDVDPEANARVVEALYGWLFYPQLKDGNPVPAEVKVTVQR